MDKTTRFDATIRQQLHVFVDHLRAADGDLQERMLKENLLLREDDAALRWFLDNANDTWRLNPKAIYQYIRMWAPRIVFIDHFPFQNHVPLTDGTRYVILTSLRQAWADNGDREDSRERKILYNYKNGYLHEQFFSLLQRGAIGRDTTLQAPATLMSNGYSTQFYTHESPQMLRDTYAEYGRSDALKEIDAAHADHFLKSWLPNLLPHTEYEAVRGIELSLLRELYAHIWSNGPALLRAAYIVNLPSRTRYEIVTPVTSAAP